MNHRNKIPEFNEFLKTHELFQAALVEAVHRYYYDYCFSAGEESRFLGTDEAIRISNLHQTLHCLNPSWRHILKKKTERYFGEEKTTGLIKESKPRRRTELVNINVIFEY